MRDVKDHDWTPGTYDYPRGFVDVDQNACYVEGQKTNVPHSTPTNSPQIYGSAWKFHALGQICWLPCSTPALQTVARQKSVIVDMERKKNAIIAAATFYTAEKLGILGWAEPQTGSATSPRVYDEVCTKIWY